MAACGQGHGREAKAAVADSSAAAPAAVSAAADSVEVTVLLRSLSGELRIERAWPAGGEGPWDDVTTVQADGDTLVVDSTSYTMEVFGWWEEPSVMAPEGRTPAAPLGSIALLEVVSGGIACPALFRVVELLSDGPPVVTDEFGTCAEAPAAVWFDASGAMRMRFNDYATVSASSEPGFREDPPTTFIYRTGGHLEEVAGR